MIFSVTVCLHRSICHHVRFGVSASQENEPAPQSPETCHVRTFILRAGTVLTILLSYGVTAGAEAFASSVVSGVEGVVVSFNLEASIKLLNLTNVKLKPIEGAESEGAKGFFKGVGKGLIG